MKARTLEKLSFKNRIKTARIFFIFSALYGLLMRFYKISTIFPATYKHILEAHSHVAFLGWGFLAVITLIDFAFLKNSVDHSVFFKRLFVLMAISVLGMLISFPLQGYHFFSILFLSVFLVSSYLYLWKVLQSLENKKEIATKFLKSGIHFYFLSSIAVWTVGVIGAKLGKHILYYDAIYFYLHFLYNGFFVFALFSLFYRFIEINSITVNPKYVTRFYQFTLYACIPAYALSLLWIVMPNYVYIIGFVAGILQLISLVYLFFILRSVFPNIKSVFIKRLLWFVMISYFLKIILQFLSVFPSFMQLALRLKPYFIIGYLHLFTLGFMSAFIILLLLMLPKFRLSEIGIKTFVLGAFLSEFFLFLNGILLLSFNGIIKINELLFVVSILMPLGILIIHFSKK